MGTPSLSTRMACIHRCACTILYYDTSTELSKQFTNVRTRHTYIYIYINNYRERHTTACMYTSLPGGRSCWHHVDGSSEEYPLHSPSGDLLQGRRGSGLGVHRKPQHPRNSQSHFPNKVSEVRITSYHYRPSLSHSLFSLSLSTSLSPSFFLSLSLRLTHPPMFIRYLVTTLSMNISV